MDGGDSRRWAETAALLANGPMVRKDGRPWEAEDFDPRTRAEAAAGREAERREVRRRMEERRRVKG